MSIKYPPRFGRSPFSIHFWNRLPPVNSRCFIDYSDTHFRIMGYTYHICRPRSLIDCCNRWCYPICCGWKSNKTIGGGNLKCFKNIHHASFGIVAQTDIVFNSRILISRIESTGNTAMTNILRLDSTEQQRSPQSRFRHLPEILVRFHYLLPDSSHRTLQAFRH